MLSLLRHPVFLRLFSAQVVALLGSGLATVALGLLAFELAGAEAGAVLGTALAIKMVAYVGVAPIARALAERWPSRRVLVALDLVRVGLVATLPFVDAVWQIYLLIFLLQSASAAFTPTFQALLPEVLPDERDYTRALSWSRLAYDLESLLSPALAAALLTLMNFHWLFAGTALGFVASALLLLAGPLPGGRAPDGGSFRARATRGLRIYLATPRLRGLLALNLAAAAAGAMVIVNSVVAVQGALGLGNGAVALALAAFGGGSMLAALLLPSLLERLGDRRAMVGGAVLLLLALAAAAAGFARGLSWPTLLLLWFVIGGGYAAVLTPGGRLLRRSASTADRPALFAAQFALSHACWLVTYPLAGWLGAAAGLAATSAALALCAAAGLLAALRLWRVEVGELEHLHPDLPADHPHVADARPAAGGRRHRHAFVIDDLHRRWPA